MNSFLFAFRISHACIKVAIGEIVDDETTEPDKIYLALYLKKNPHEAMFLELRQQPVLMRPDDPDFSWPAENDREYEFLEPLVLLRQDQVPVDARGELVAITGVSFHGGIACSGRPAIGFEQHARLQAHRGSEIAPGSGGGGGGGIRKAPAVASGMMREMVALHPWLENGDFMPLPASLPKRPRIGVAAAPRAAPVPLAAAAARDDAADAGGDGGAALEDGDDGHSEAVPLLFMFRLTRIEPRGNW